MERSIKVEEAFIKEYKGVPCSICGEEFNEEDVKSGMTQFPFGKQRMAHKICVESRKANQNH
jgi:hypothetical protein